MMSVHNKFKIKKHVDILNERYTKLVKILEGRETGSDLEPFPKDSIILDDLEVRLAVDDFNNILKEIKKMK